MDDPRAEDGAIFEALYPSLRRFAGAIRPVGVDADDLVQEALARTLAVRSLSSIDEPLAYLRTAMVRVASNLARGARRNDARQRRELPQPKWSTCIRRTSTISTGRRRGREPSCS